MEHLVTIPFGVGSRHTTDALNNDERHIHACFHHPLVYPVEEGTVRTDENRQLGFIRVENDDPFFGDPCHHGGPGANHRDDFVPIRQRAFHRFPLFPNAVGASASRRSRISWGSLFVTPTPAIYVRASKFPGDSSVLP